MFDFPTFLSRNDLMGGPRVALFYSPPPETAAALVAPSVVPRLSRLDLDRLDKALRLALSLDFSADEGFVSLLIQI